MPVILRVQTEYTGVINITLRESKILNDSLRYYAARSANMYNPSFASGQWDGYVRMFDRRLSRFPTGLLARVKAIFNREGIEYTVQKALPDHPAKHPIGLWTPEGYALRPYQEEAVQRAHDYYRGIIRIPTGGGKTDVAQALIHKAQSPRVVFLVPNRVLLHQTYKRFKQAFPHENVLYWGDGNRPQDTAPDSYILVSTVQTAWKWTDGIVLTDAQKRNKAKAPKPYRHPMLEKATAIIVDECHHQAAETFQRATRVCNQARYLIGLSATPFRDDGADLEMEAWLGPVIYNIGYEELIRDGYLVEPEFAAVGTLDEAITKVRGMRALIFSEEISNLEQSMDVFQKHGVIVHTGRDKSSDIQRTIKRFRDGEILQVACTPIFDEGLDVPNLDAIVNFATGRSKVRTLQRIGRAMRPAPGKTRCLVVDVTNHTYPDRVQTYLTEPAFASRYGGRRQAV